MSDPPQCYTSMKDRELKPSEYLLNICFKFYLLTQNEVYNNKYL